MLPACQIRRCGIKRSQDHARSSWPASRPKEQAFCSRLCSHTMTHGDQQAYKLISTAVCAVPTATHMCQ